MTDFTYEKQQKMADRIQKISEKANLIHIKTIIKKHNPNLEMTKNSNGYFFDFKNLSKQTYIELNNFLDKIDKKELQDNNDANKLSDTLKYSLELSDKNNNKKLKYTNSENHILNRVKYENALKIHQSDYDTNDTKDGTKNENIFKKK